MKCKKSYWHIKMIPLMLMLGLMALFTTPLAQAKATQRPIEEFIDAQGTYCVDDGAGGCFLFVPPLENFVGWSDPAQELFASVDYAGLANTWLKEQSSGAVDLNTAFIGNVTERLLADGRAEVIVNLSTRNALTWVVDGYDFTASPLLFGDRAPEVLTGAKPGLCDSHLLVKFINTAPGVPLPDLIQLLFAPEIGQELLSLAMRCNAEGPLHEGFDDVEDGTPGRAIVLETGLFMTGYHGAVADGFPVEKINLKVIGKKEKD